jgi:putative endonuclease
MFYVYILKSLKNSSLYFGYTADLRRRFSEHNAGKSNYTKNLIPWVLVYYEAYKNSSDARRRERALKNSGKAYGQLKGRIIESLKIDG